MKLDILDTDYLSSADAPAGGPLRAAYDSAMSLAPLSRCILVSFTAAIVLLLLARAAGSHGEPNAIGEADMGSANFRILTALGNGTWSSEACIRPSHFGLKRRRRHRHLS